MNFKRHTSAFKNLPGPLLWVLQFYNLIVSSPICRGEWKGGSPSPVICFPPLLHVSDILCGLQTGLSLCYCVPGSHWQKTEKRETNTRECPPSPVTTLSIPSCRFSSTLWPSHCFVCGSRSVLFTFSDPPPSLLLHPFQRMLSRERDTVYVDLPSSQNHPLPGAVLWIPQYTAHPSHQFISYFWFKKEKKRSFHNSHNGSTWIGN